MLSVIAWTVIEIMWFGVAVWSMFAGGNFTEGPAMYTVLAVLSGVRADLSFANWQREEQMKLNNDRERPTKISGGDL